MTVPPVVRPGRDGDAAGFIALISGCWAEYPGCVFDLDGEVPELRALASHYAAKQGALWVGEAEGRVVGMVGAAPSGGAGAWEIGKMYVEPGFRGGGLAHTLLAAAEAHAAERGAGRIELWSDTRFDRAHRFYEKRSFVRAGAIRPLFDKSNSIEFHYAKPVAGIAPLDAAGAASAVTRLAAVLAACVADGAAAGFRPPLATETARAFWRGAAKGVATGSRRLLAGWIGGELLGTVQLDLATPPDGPHRADLGTLLVAPAGRRRGLARALVTRAEAEAQAAGRSLLTLRARAGCAAEPLVRSMGWHEGGRIPGYSLDPDGRAADAVLFWKRVDGDGCPDP